MAFDLARHLLLAERPEEALKALDQSKPAADSAQAANLRALRAVALRQIAQARRSRTTSDEDAAAASSQGRSTEQRAKEALWSISQPY